MSERLEAELRTDDLGGVLRALSVRKKHGILALTAGKERFDIRISGGAIVGCERTGELPAAAVLGRLIQSGLLDPHEEELYPCQEYNELVEALTGRIDRETIDRARQVYELELLHSLRHIERPKSVFHPRIVTSDEHAALNIAPGQLLLDFVEHESDEDRFREIFFEPSGNECEVIPLAVEIPDCGRSVAEVWKRVRVSPSISEILRSTLLTTHETCAALLALYDRNAISVNRCEADPIDDQGFLDVLEEEFSDSDEAAIVEQPDAPRMGLMELNWALQEEQGRQAAAAVCACAVLLLVAVLIPGEFQELFDALRAMTHSPGIGL